MRRCEVCQFSEQDRWQPKNLECRYASPRGGSSPFPKVSGECWCGRFRQRPHDELPPQMLTEIAERAKCEGVLREFAQKVLDMMRESAKAQGGLS